MAEKSGGVVDGEELFRQEALAHHLRRDSGEGRVLELSPRWTRWAYRLLLFIFAGSLIFALVASVDEYARGSFIVRAHGRADVTTPQAGTVTAVEVEAGQKVAAGQLLARFYSAGEAAELGRIRREFELALIQRLRAPSDPATERILSSLRAQKELAEARLEERSLRSPVAGVVSDLRVRPGQHVLPGEVVVSVAGEQPEMSVIAMLPGHFRPLIRSGMPLRLELDGYRYAYQRLQIDRVGEDVLAPSEARRFLGASAGDALTLGGPVIFVYARLPSSTFESSGREYLFHEGMRGSAEVRVRSEGVLTALIPGLEAVFTSRSG